MRRLKLAGWQIASTLLLLAVAGAVVALGVLNARRDVTVPSQALSIVASPAASPSPAVTARVRVEPTATPRPTQTPSAAAVGMTPPPTDIPARQEARVANTGGAGVTVRADPGPQAASAGTLREGAVVQLTGAEQTVAARLWREVMDDARGLRGWVLSDYLEPL